MAQRPATGLSGVVPQARECTEHNFMTAKRMLVDASHPEETRIVVTSGNRLDEFDFESANKRQLRGNIYLAKVTRVEPSLQAAFVDYGGNRHGFLAFSEIHPDYYQIPKADREALLRAEEEAARLEAEKALAEENAEEDTSGNRSSASADDQDTDTADTDDDVEETGAHVEDDVDDLGGGEGEDLLELRRAQTRRYKIQEVIKRRQVLLVQVVKEERGNKGAALTTYLSLAGRYSVLMPNTARGGGISRKITSGADRKRLKQIASDLNVPAGMGVILRTAGASRTKAEIKRDFEYLSRLWENVRQLTMSSSAPSLVYEEGSLIKRTIRDLYNKEISEVLVAGDEAYREAKSFMQLIMPSHAKNVKAYKEAQHLFSRYNVESQLDSMFSPQVTLPSGGYIVINPTEALVSIDVNSGRATREHNIEATALQTNLEAADEAARQFRLRDLAGLIVIDFIDMTERRSIRAVEKRLKDALKNDRARIQVGRISHFGLLEMSRQRMRFGVLESTTHACPACEGTGIIRAVESRALMVMRAIEDHVVRKPGNSIEVKAPTEVALYLLNSKRASLSELENRYGLSITITVDANRAASEFAIERGQDRHDPTRQIANGSVSVDSAPAAESESDTSEEGETRSGRKRRKRRSGRGETGSNETDTAAASADSAESQGNESPDGSPETDGEDQPRKRRRRGRRGGRRNRRNGAATEVTQAEAGNTPDTEQSNGNNAETAPEPQDDGTPDSSSGAGEAETAPDAGQTAEPAAPGQQEATEEKPAKKRPRRSARGKAKADKDGDEGSKRKAPKAARAAKADKADEAAAAEKPAASETTANGADTTPKTPGSEKESGNGAQDNAEQKASQPETAAPQSPEPKPSETDRKPARDLPEEGMIVVTSSTPEGEAPPRRKGWWSR